MSLLAKFAIFTIAIFVVVCGTALLFSARPTPVLGYNGDALFHSIGKGDDSFDDCREAGDGWICRITGDKADSKYRIDTRWDGCWEGTHVAGPVNAYTPQNISGCIDIWDHLRLENTFD